jgi:hypothetical protein
MNDEQLIWESYVETLKENTEQDEFYIRFGDIPEGKFSKIGPSIVGKGNEPLYERGISCFWAKWLPDLQRWLISDADHEQLVTLIDVAERPMYLIKGKEIGYGTDGEPLLQKDTIRVLTKLQPSDVYHPDLEEYFMDEHPRLSEPYPEWNDLIQKEKFASRVLSQYSHYAGKNNSLYDMYKTELYRINIEYHKRVKEWQRTHVLKSDVSPDNFL